MNKVFFDGFYEVAHYFETSNNGPTIIRGFGNELEINLLINDSKKNLINALLIHDRIIIKAVNVLNLINWFGFFDTIEILKSGAIEFIEEDFTRPLITAHSPQNISLDHITMTSHKDTMGFLEKRLISNYSHSRANFPFILSWVYKLKTPPIQDISTYTIKELAHDLNSNPIRKLYALKTDDLKNIHVSDVHTIERLITLNNGLCHSGALNCKNIIIDGAVKNLINAKISSPLFQRNIKDPLDAFDHINRTKNIPDLGSLYLERKIGIRDILELRSSFNGKKFRDWLESINYDRKEILEGITSLPNNKFKKIRFVLNSAIGLIHPLTSLAGNYVDSFLLDKLVGGWHPNFFLDGNVTNLIDKTVKNQNKKAITELNIKYSGS